MIDKKAYQKMDYALCLLSAHADGKDSGCIINSSTISATAPAVSRISFPHTRSDAMRSETPTLPTVWSPGYPAV